jgi:hypothetical protein
MSDLRLEIRSRLACVHAECTTAVSGRRLSLSLELDGDPRSDHGVRRGGQMANGNRDQVRTISRFQRACGCVPPHGMSLERCPLAVALRSESRNETDIAGIIRMATQPALHAYAQSVPMRC